MMLSDSDTSNSDFLMLVKTTYRLERHPERDFARSAPILRVGGFESKDLVFAFLSLDQQGNLSRDLRFREISHLFQLPLHLCELFLHNLLIRILRNINFLSHAYQCPRKRFWDHQRVP
jgi:hypothetical protein